MTEQEQREFALGDILTVTTGRFVSRRHVGGMYDILGYMTGGTLYTHQLPGAIQQCAPALLEQHPQLKNVSIPDKFEDEDHVWRWLKKQELTYGEALTVRPLPNGAYAHVDPS